MAYIFLVGIVISLLVFGIYFIIIQKHDEPSVGLSWKMCFFYGLQIYLISIILGALATAIFENADGITENFGSVITGVLGMLMYAMVFTFFIVLPALIIGLKVISKMSLTPDQKRMRFSLIGLILVVLINLIMSSFMANAEFIVFLSGFSFFGILTPWLFVNMRKVFEE